MDKQNHNQRYII